MELMLGGIYRISRYKNPLCIAISENTLVGKLPKDTDITFIDKSEYEFVLVEEATLLDLMKSWGTTTARFDELVGPITRSIYRNRAKGLDQPLSVKLGDLFPDDQKEKHHHRNTAIVIALRDRKLSIVEAAAEFGLAPSHIARIAKRRGLVLKPGPRFGSKKPFKPKKDYSKVSEYGAQLLAGTMDVKTVAKLTGMTRNTVRRALKKLGIDADKLPRAKTSYPARRLRKKVSEQFRQVLALMKAGQSIYPACKKVGARYESIRAIFVRLAKRGFSQDQLVNGEIPSDL